MSGDELRTIKECADAARVHREGIQRVLNNEKDLKPVHRDILTDIMMGLTITCEKLSGLI